MNRLQAAEKLKSQEKPFSFYAEDRDKFKSKVFKEPEVNPECRVSFKAKKIPEMYMQPDELEHQEKQK